VLIEPAMPTDAQTGPCSIQGWTTGSASALETALMKLLKIKAPVSVLAESRD
jgi:hypothetical protein